MLKEVLPKVITKGAIKMNSDNHYDIKHFYRLDTVFKTTNHKLSFFEEVDGNDNSYWINALEIEDKADIYGNVAIRFTREDLIELRDSINKML